MIDSQPDPGFPTSASTTPDVPEVARNRWAFRENFARGKQRYQTLHPPQYEARKAALEAKWAERDARTAQMREDFRVKRGGAATTPEQVAADAARAGMSVVDYAAAQAVLTGGQAGAAAVQQFKTVTSGGVKHGLHATLTVFTCGLWAPVWLLATIFANKKIKTTVPR
jgi:hypothetical protein